MEQLKHAPIPFERPLQLESLLDLLDHLPRIRNLIESEGIEASVDGVVLDEPWLER